MIDLIIPYYNNPEGLARTLNSIEKELFYITIIDDSSDYTPWCPSANQVFRYNKNHGPGYARQLGIDKTLNKYIMFIDTGDIFTYPDVQYEVIDYLNNNPEVEFWSFPYFHEGKLTEKTDNRLHGKIYKRSFLEKYDITFAAESSYMNEDIGFNRTCRYCTEMMFINLPVIEQVQEINSLTQKNNKAALYRDQTRALSLVTLHTLDILRKNNISTEEEINQIAIALYYWFIRTVAERPEFIQDAWAGAKIFYDALAQEIKPNQLALGNAYLKNCLQYRNKISFQINILRFAYDIQHFNKVPKKYKGGD